MFGKRFSVTATTKQQSSTMKTASTKTNSTSTDESAKHYNNWPNAVGFDAVYEEHEPVDVPVEGFIPAYAAGTLFRTGIGPRTVGADNGKPVFTANHWFDGFSQVHRFQLHTPTPSDPDAGIERITYNSRLTCDQLIERIRRTGKLEDFTFGAQYEPCRSFYQKVQAIFEKAPYSEPGEINAAITMSINYPGLSSTGTPHTSSHSANTITTLCNKTDASRLQFLDPQTLKPTGLVGQEKLHPQLKGDLAAAHAEADTSTGDVFNYNLEFGSRYGTYRVFRTSASTGKTSILATFEYPQAYLHSFFLTEHFVVLCIWNSHFKKYGASILWARNMLDAIYFNKSPATWFVVDRRCPDTEGGKGVVAKFQSDPFFAFHTVNAYEVPHTSDGKSNPENCDQSNAVDLICDICAFENTDIIHNYYMDNLVSSNPTAHAQAERMKRYDHIGTTLRRYRLPSVPLPGTTSPTSTRSFPALSSSTPTHPAILEFTALKDQSVDLPTYNPAHKMKPYRYVYGTFGPSGQKSTFIDGLLKHDLHTHEVVKWEREGQTPGEAIFLPNPNPNRKPKPKPKPKPKSDSDSQTNGTGNLDSTTNEVPEADEDDGILLTVVLDGYTSKSYLLCLNARDMTELGRASVAGPIGFGFHGAHTGVI